MGQVSKTYTFAAGATIIASEHNTNFDTLYNEFNGNIENANIKSGAAIAAAKLNLSTIAQDVAFSSSELLLAKGVDIASASSIALGGDGNYYDITGTTNIQTITAKQAGSVVWLQFDGALTLVDNTGNLELNGADLDVQAEDVVCLVCDGTNWLLVCSTASQLQFASQDQGDIVYRDSSAWARLGAGTSGQFLQTQGTGANPQWANQGLTLTSTTTVSTSNNSGDITISSNNFYKVLFYVTALATSDSTFQLRFNSGSGANYKDQDGSTTSIIISPTVGFTANTENLCLVDLTLDTFSSGNYEAKVLGNSMSIDGATAIQGKLIYGTWDGGAPTSFEIITNTTNNYSGVIKLYTIATS